jgi:hypothetical protein
MTLLIGVAHEEKYLDQVLNGLSNESLKDKKVMLETFSYPLTDDLRAMNISFVNFWEGVSNHILDKGRNIIFGENSSLYYGARENIEYCNRQISQKTDDHYKILLEIQKIPSWDRDKENKLASWLKRDDEVRKELKLLYHKSNKVYPFINRDPHFAKVVRQETPDIIILGANHIPYLINNCFFDKDYFLSYVPLDKIQKLL